MSDPTSSPPGEEGPSSDAAPTSSGDTTTTTTTAAPAPAASGGTGNNNTKPRPPALNLQPETDTNAAAREEDNDDDDDAAAFAARTNSYATALEGTVTGTVTTSGAATTAAPGSPGKTAPKSPTKSPLGGGGPLMRFLSGTPAAPIMDLIGASDTDEPEIDDDIRAATEDIHLLPPPGARLVEPLSSAELHELRKDSNLIKKRFMHIMKVFQEAKINEEYIYPNGEKRIVRTIEVVQAAHELMRLLRMETRSIGLSFNDLSVTVKQPADNTIDTTGTAIVKMVKKVFGMFRSADKSQESTVFEGVSGWICPGETVLVIGPAGSGCSSLMKVLAGRYDSRSVSVSGDLSYNETNCSQDKVVFQPPTEISSGVKFCYEGDVHIPELSVTQTLEFQADLANPKKVGPPHTYTQQLYKEAMKKIPHTIVKQVMRNMGIAHVADTPVGDDLIRGVSGGQKKRVTFGEVVCSRPDLAFYDGYTKGLDSATALGLARTMSSVCWNMQGGMTVVASQYQASQEIFEVFDKVLVLQKEDDPSAPSQMVYFGSTDSNDLEEFFSSVGYEKPPEYTWPDYLGTMKGGRHVSETGPRKEGQPQNAAELAARFRQHRLGQRVQDAIRNQEHTELNPKIVAGMQRLARASMVPGSAQQEVKATDQFDHLQQSPEFAKAASRLITAGFMVQLLVAVRKEWTLLKARQADTIATFMISILMGLIVGCLFLQLPETFDRAFDRTGVILNVTVLSATAVFNIVPKLLGDREVMYRHTRNNMYRGAVFFIAKSIVELPALFVTSIIISAIIPTLCGFQVDGDHWIYFLLNHFMLSFAGVNVVKGFVFLGSGLFNGYLMGFFSVVTMMLMNGFMLPAEKLGWWFRWFTYINPLQWAFAGFVINEFDGLTFTEAPVPGGSIGGENVRKNFFFIDYDTDFKWAILGINFALGLAGLAWGSWVCENIRHDSGKHRVKFHVPCDVAMQHSAFRRRMSALAALAPKRKSRPTGDRANSQQVSPADSTAGDNNDGDSHQAAQAAAADAAVAVDVPPIKGHEDAYFTFSNVSYTVDVPVSEANPDGKLKLLNNVNGFATPGMMIALMGTSGAGKTTLLDVLARRKTSGTIEGEILVNGFPQDDTFSRLVGYVEQTDMHLARATISEAFMFAARLGRAPGESDAELRTIVNNIIKLLELDSLHDAMIGSPDSNTGISAEAMKRVTMGVELVTDPSILFMDEPTSGLDTAGALLVANVARNIARSGKTVICTIHQPSRMVLEAFDYMLLMKKGGNTVYFGEIGPSSQHLVNFFESNGAPTFDKLANPAEVMLDVVAPSAGKAEFDWSSEKWIPSEQYKQLLKKLENKAAGIVPEGTAAIKFDHTIAAGPLTQFVQLIKRQSVSTWRNPGTTLGLFYASLYPAFLCGLMFINLTGDNDENGANYTSTALYSSAFITPAFFIFLCLPGVYEDRAAFYRETSSGLYSKAIYAFSLQLATVPYLVAAATLNSVIGYHLIGLREGGYGYFWVMFASFMFMAWMQGIAIGALTPSMAIGTAAVMAPLNISNFFCGFLIVRDDIGWWFRWLYYFNPSALTYVMQGLYKNEFEPRVFTNTPGITTGRQFLASYGWNDNEGEHLTKWECVGIVWIYAAMWFCIGQYALITKRHGTR